MPRNRDEYSLAVRRAYIARVAPEALADFDATEAALAAFAAENDVVETDCSDRNLSLMLGSTGEQPERVAEMRAILSRASQGDPGGRSYYNGRTYQPSLGCYGAFDHPTMWRRGRHPVMLVGHPYGLSDDVAAELDYLSRAFAGSLRVTVDAYPSFYGHGTNHVRVELVEVRRPFRKLPSTHKTRAAARAARKAFRDELEPSTRRS
jgi:hypothetical protein